DDRIGLAGVAGQAEYLLAATGDGLLGPGLAAVAGAHQQRREGPAGARRGEPDLGDAQVALAEVGDRLAELARQAPGGAAVRRAGQVGAGLCGARGPTEPP